MARRWLRQSAYRVVWPSLESFGNGLQPHLTPKRGRNGDASSALQGSVKRTEQIVLRMLHEGGKRPSRGRFGKGPESALKPAFHCERELDFTPEAVLCQLR